jgi:hypothetical protein
MQARIGPKLCCDCKHSYEQLGIRDSYSQAKVIEAVRCRLKVASPVHGQMGDPLCEWSRAFETMCGPAGRWWEPRERTHHA